MGTMDHACYGEVQHLFETFTRVWGSGGQASLHLHTQDGMSRNTLDIQLEQKKKKNLKKDKRTKGQKIKRTKNKRINKRNNKSSKGPKDKRTYGQNQNMPKR